MTPEQKKTAIEQEKNNLLLQMGNCKSEAEANAILTGFITEHTEQLEQLTKDRDSWKQSDHDRNRKYGKLSQENKQLQEQLEQKDKEISDWKIKASEQQTFLDAKCAQLSQAKEQIASLKASLSKSYSLEEIKENYAQWVELVEAGRYNGFFGGFFKYLQTKKEGK